jgi:hypothetical protein
LSLGKIHNRFEFYSKTINWAVLGIWQGYIIANMYFEKYVIISNQNILREEV